LEDEQKIKKYNLERREKKKGKETTTTKKKKIVAHTVFVC
jgi:hypothetical protein